MQNSPLNKRLKLANIPTPVEDYNFKGFSFLIKRDDLTGFETSGNKIRKLEYIFEKAVSEGVTTVYTCGGEQSNHSRATVVAAAKLGLKCKLFLWGRKRKNITSNLFIDLFLNAEIQYLTKKEWGSVEKFMTEDKIYTERNSNQKILIIPEGGSSEEGILGYINFLYELKEQVDLRNLSGICIATGSGGTAAGLIAGLSILNITHLKIYCVNVLYSKPIIQNRIYEMAENTLNKYFNGVKLNKNTLEILDGYSKEGYKKISTGKIRLIREFASNSGIILDPAYTGKAFCAFYDLLQNGHKNVLFLHTGGGFGVFSKTKQYLA